MKVNSLIIEKMISDFLEINPNSDKEFVPFLKTHEEFRDFSALLSELDGPEVLRLAMTANENCAILKAFRATPYLRGLGTAISEKECLRLCFYPAREGKLDAEYNFHYYFLATGMQL